MNELQKLIKKWDEQIALHRRVCEDPLMYTKEDRLKNSHYAQAICAVVADLKKLTIPAVVGRSEQLVLFADWLQYNGKWDLPEKQVKKFLSEQKQN